MSFLGLLRPRTHLDSTSSQGEAPTPSIKSTTSTFRKRLSSFNVFRSSRRLRKSAPNGAVGFTAAGRSPYEGYSQSRETTPEPSLEIRRPSGLGRRASITSDGWWAEEERPLPERKQSVSTPELTLFFDTAAGKGKIDLKEKAWGVKAEEVKRWASLPAEVVKRVLEYVPQEEVWKVGLTCRAFLAVARARTYRNINLLNASQHQVDRCINLLAQKRDLAVLVDCFACTSLPQANTSGASSPLPSVSFAIALNNMQNITRLVLSWFDSALLFHTTFRLRHLEFLCSTASRGDLEALSAWLTNQRTIASLSFPQLHFDEETAQWLAGAGSQLSDIPEDDDGPEEECRSALFPPTVLPVLESLCGPSSLVTVLVPGRPVASVKIHLHTTIYDGLRPSSVVAELGKSTVPIASLAVVATAQSRIDARTIERVVMAAGAELGASVTTLEIECALETQVLYKQVTAVLPRYRTLQTLRLWRDVAEALPSGPPDRVVFPTSSPPSPPSSSADAASPERTMECAQFVVWRKHCPTLSLVVFPSGASWQMSEGVDGPTVALVGVVEHIKSDS